MVSWTFKSIFVDGVMFPMRIDGSIEKVPVLVAIGVTEKGHRTVLGLQSGDKESATSWREFFKDLKRRGLNGNAVTLGIMDGLTGSKGSSGKNFPTPRCRDARSTWHEMYWPRCQGNRRKLLVTKYDPASTPVQRQRL